MATIQIIKFDFLDRFLKWNKSKSSLLISDYKPYSMQKFVKVEGAASVLLDSNFTFFIYTLPQNIIFCATCYFLFHLLRKYGIRASKYFKKFYFLKTTLAVVLLEGNLAYFMFVCFLHLQVAFSFNLADKLSLSFTILLLFALVSFCFCFYLMLFRYLGKRASKFTENIYR